MSLLVVGSEDLSSWPAERLETEICRGAADLAAAQCRWLWLVAEFDRRMTWASWGCRSAAQWLSWQCGLSPVTGHEHVRVARTLDAFPATRELFAAGLLSYSKVRAMTRVLRPDNEETLIEYARNGTAGQLERIVRAYRSVDDGTGSDDGRPARYLSWRWDDDGTLDIHARMDAEEGMLFLKSLGVADDELHPRPTADDSAESPPPAPPPAAADNADQPAPVADDADQPDAESDGHSDEAVGAGDADQQDDSAESWPDEDGWSDDDGWGDWAPISFVDDDGETVTIGGPPPTTDRPEPARADDSAESPPPRPGPGRYGYGQRWVDALRLMSETMLAHGPEPQLGTARNQVLLHVDLNLLAAGDTDPTGRAAGWLQDGPAVPRPILEQILCDCGLRAVIDGQVGTTLDIGRLSRQPTERQRMAVWARDGGCGFEDCGQHRFADIHHMIPWSPPTFGPTNLDNLCLLCRFHHRFVHTHNIRVELGPDGKPRFFWPDGTPVAPHTIGPRDPLDIGRSGGDLLALSAEPNFDLGQAVYSLLPADQRFA